MTLCEIAIRSKLQRQKNCQWQPRVGRDQLETKDLPKTNCKNKEDKLEFFDSIIINLMP